MVKIGQEKQEDTADAPVVSPKGIVPFWYKENPEHRKEIGTL